MINLELLGNNVLNMINELLSKSLIDNHVSDDEFKKILNEYQEYIRRCKKHQRCFHWRTFVEKAKIKEDIDKVFNK